jgi:hypothetical protein
LKSPLPSRHIHHVEVAPPRAEPLSFLTLETVEGIVRSTDVEAQKGQTSWESRMEKSMSLGDAYSSVNTHTGEKCYMVDGALYKDILLAVAARRQNERSLSTATEKLEHHIEQVGSSNERVLQGEKDALERMARRMNRSFIEIREEHQTRMRNVITDIRVLKDSMVSSAEDSTNSNEMQQLRFQVERYEQIIPVYQAQIKDTQELN